jgi:hypothetical protein
MKLARAHTMMLALLAVMMANVLFWPHHRLALLLALPVAYAVALRAKRGLMLLILAVVLLFIVESVPQMMMWVYPKQYAESVLRVVLWMEERGASLWGTVFFWAVALRLVWPSRSADRGGHAAALISQGTDFAKRSSLEMTSQARS